MAVAQSLKKQKKNFVPLKAKEKAPLKAQTERKVEEVGIREVKRILVDSVNGPVRTINQAIEMAEGETVIKLCDSNYCD